MAILIFNISQMNHVYKKRQNAIRKCVDSGLSRVQAIKAQRESSDDEQPQLTKQLRKQQTAVRSDFFR